MRCYICNDKKAAAVEGLMKTFYLLKNCFYFAAELPDTELAKSHEASAQVAQNHKYQIFLSCSKSARKSPKITKYQLRQHCLSQK